MKTFIASKNDANLRLDKFITKTVPLLPQTLMYKYIRTKRIKINGKKAEINTRLNLGDTVDMYINDEFFKPVQPNFDFLSAPDNIDIVYEDQNILLIDKKQGVLVHPDKNEYCNTLISRVHHYLYNKGEYNPNDKQSFRPALANRIDRNTGGIVIVAKNAEALRIICDKIKHREIDKFYLAVTHGIPKIKSAELVSYLKKDQNKNQVFLKNYMTDGAKTIKTKYTVIATNKDLALINIELLTGRTHQIRAHMASIGHPLLGDGKYGINSTDKKNGFKYQALYSYKLRFNFQTPTAALEYLNGKTFTVKNVWFADQLFKETDYLTSIE